MFPNPPSRLGNLDSSKPAPQDNILATRFAVIFQPEVAPSLGQPEALPDLVSKERNFVWVDLTGYTRDEMQTIAHLLGLHRTGVRATLALWQRPCLDLFDDHFFVTATIPALDHQAYRVEAR